MECLYIQQHSTIGSLLKKIRLTFADYIALVYGFSHHIAGTIYKAQEQHVSIALVLFCYFKKFFDFFSDSGYKSPLRVEC